MPNMHHEEGLARVSRIEHDNQHQGRTGGKGPVKSFGQKGQRHNATNKGGINRPLKPTSQH